MLRYALIILFFAATLPLVPHFLKDLQLDEKTSAAAKGEVAD